MRHIKKNSEIVFLSDFIDLLDEYHLQRFLKDQKTHCFRLISPVEELSKGFFRIPVNSAEGKYVWRPYSKKEKKKDSPFRKNMKFINVKDRYLETFIKEMHKS